MRSRSPSRHHPNGLNALVCPELEFIGKILPTGPFPKKEKGKTAELGT